MKFWFLFHVRKNAFIRPCSDISRQQQQQQQQHTLLHLFRQLGLDPTPPPTPPQAKNEGYKSSTNVKQLYNAIKGTLGCLSPFLYTQQKS